MLVTAYSMTQTGAIQVPVAIIIVVITKVKFKVTLGLS